MHAAHAISVVFHGYDDSYMEDAIEASPLRLRGSHVCDPASTPEKEVARLGYLHEHKGFTGVRFKPNLWADAGTSSVPYNDDVGRAVAKACGERDMVCRGTWARVTIDQFRHWRALQTFKKHTCRVSNNIFSNTTGGRDVVALHDGQR